MRLSSLSYLTSICLALGGAGSVRGAIIYSGLQDIAIPTDRAGVYLDIETGFASGSSFSGWDINPFYGGYAIATNTSFQPARVAASNGSAIVRYEVGDFVGSSLFPSLTGPVSSFGYGGSLTGFSQETTPGKFRIGDEGYLAFRFITNNGLSMYYGWMRVVFTANTSGAVIRDWAYEDGTGQDGGGSLMVGRVQQSPASGGVRLTTLSPGVGESFTLGSPVVDPLGGSNVGSVLKIGHGTTTFAASQSYTGATTIDTGTLEIAAGGQLSGTASVAVNTGGTLLFSGPGGVNAKVSSASILNLGGGQVAASGLTSSLDQQFGVLTLSENSTIDFGMLAAGNTLRFADTAGATWTPGRTLNIWNWTSGADHLFFGSSSAGIAAGQLSQVRFYSDNGITLLGQGYHGSLGEVTPVPEPSSLALAVGLLGVVGIREHGKARSAARERRARSALRNRVDWVI
jgi:autotransporter-associated beta strand protein